MRRKVLYLSQVYPFPTDGGGKIKTYHTLVALAKEYDVFAIFISEYQPNQSEIAHLEKLGIRVTVFFSSHVHASVKDDLWHLARKFAQGIPHYVFQYTLPEAFPYIAQAIEEFQPEIIHIDHLNIAQYLPKEKKQLWVLEHHNVEFYLLWTRFLHSTRLSRKFYLLLESFFTFLFERRMLKKFDYVFTISRPEELRVRRIFGIKNVVTQPLVYAAEKIKRKRAKVPYVLFIGSVKWPPNEDAVEWFATQVWPRVLQHVPSAEFHVVGVRNHPWEKVVMLPKQIFFHDFQKDLIHFLAQAHVFVLPFRMGGGVRLKSLTAMSAGLPIVSTPLGIEGLKVKEDREYLLAKEAVGFANQVVRLLNNSQLQKKVGEHGQTYVRKRHSLQLYEKFLRMYRKVTQ